MRCALLHCSGSLIWRRKNLTILSELSNLCTCSSSISCISSPLPRLLKFHLLRQEQVVLSNFSVGNWYRSGNLHCRHNQHLRSRSPHPVNPKQVLIRLRSKVVVSDLHFFRLISRVIVINSFPFLGAKNKNIHLIICRLV